MLRKLKFTLPFGFSEITFSLNCFVAAMLALYISFFCDLERPYWAMMTAYVTSQPFSGAVRSRAVYRLFGTLAGAAAMVLLVPPLSNSPIILSLAIALWVGLCLFFAMLDRTPRSYLFVLAGFTTAVIGFPIVSAPLTSFDVAIARFEEIGVGVLCSTLIHTIFFPRSLRKSLTFQFKDILTDLRIWLADTLNRKKDAVHRRGRIRLAAGITDLYLLSTHIPFDVHEPQQVQDSIVAIQKKLIQLFPLITGVSDRFKRLEDKSAIPEHLETLLKDIADWLDAPVVDVHSGKIALQKKCLELKHLKGVPSWHDLILYNIMVRLSDLIDVYASCRLKVHEFATYTENANTSRPLRPVNRNRVLHRDYGAAWRAAISAVAIVFLGCMIWIATGWPDGSVAVMMSAVVYCFFVSRANPVMAQKSFLYQALLASIVAGIYLFAILPQTHSFATLALAFSPVLLVGGILLARPVVGIQYMAFLANFCVSLTLTEHFAPDIQSYINRSIAQFVGIASVIAVTSILHHYDAQRYIGKSLQTTWTDISRLALGTRRVSTAVWTSLMVDRIGLMAPYVGAIRGSKQYKSVNAMQELRVGLNIIRLSRAAERLAPEQFSDVRDLLRLIGVYFADLVKEGAYMPPSEVILKKIDAQIATLSGLPSNKLKETILNSLTGLRCNLFPDAWEYMYGINWHD